MTRPPSKKSPAKPSMKTQVTIEEYGAGLYQIALGAAAKAQQELSGQAGLAEYREKIDAATLGLLASGLWLVKYLARQTIHRADAAERCQQLLTDKFFEHIVGAAADQVNRKELSDYLDQLHAIYNKAWNNTNEPGRSWWLATAMAREILDAPDVPQLATVIMVGEVETTLAMGARLSRQYYISF